MLGRNVAIGRERHVHEMPARRARARVAHVVGPARDRCQRMPTTEQARHQGDGLRGEPARRSLRDERVPLLPPGEGGTRWEECEERGEQDRFHGWTVVGRKQGLVPLPPRAKRVAGGGGGWGGGGGGWASG